MRLIDMAPVQLASQRPNLPSSKLQFFPVVPAHLGSSIPFILITYSTLSSGAEGDDVARPKRLWLLPAPSMEALSFHAEVEEQEPDISPM